MVQALLPFNPAFRAQVAIFAGDWCGSMSSVRLLCVGRSATCQNSVIIGPGHTARTLIFLGFNSSRSAREKLCTYAFVEQYTAMRGVGANDAMDEMFRISPPVFIYGRLYRVTAVSARQFKSIIAVWLSMSLVAKSHSLPKPALLMSSEISGFSRSSKALNCFNAAESVRSSAMGRQIFLSGNLRL